MTNYTKISIGAFYRQRFLQSRAWDPKGFKTFEFSSLTEFSMHTIGTLLFHAYFYKIAVIGYY
jgi:hypothetical protein